MPQSLPGADVGGRPAQTAHSDALQTAQEALEGPTFLAQQTGGVIVTSTNDLNIGFEEALYDQQRYYLLGFDPEDEQFDRKYHTIKLSVTRPGMKVRTRSGFYGVNDGEGPERTKTKEQQILSAMYSPLGEHDLCRAAAQVVDGSGNDGVAKHDVEVQREHRKRRNRERPDGRGNSAITSL